LGSHTNNTLEDDDDYIFIPHSIMVLACILFPLNSLGSHHMGFSIPEYRFLYQQHITARLLDLLHNVQDVCPLFL